jgi:putative FmdB family regulatory protein
MPLFEYACRDCGREFEAIVTARTADAVRCPACASAAVGRKLPLPATVAVTGTNGATNCAGDGPPCGAQWCGRKG